MISHQLLVRGGFIRESTAGRYFFLPLGWRVHEKIKRIVKEEMDGLGAQEMLSPVLHPIELWQETNRTNTTGFELLNVTDRSGRTFALGGTAEEMFVDVVRQFQISHKDLPFTIYQFSTKFRDELRARGGLLRVREFIMKDAYSFDTGEEAFKKNYEAMKHAYKKIFKRVGLQTHVVEADNGYIGGEYCHELVVEHPQGESTFFVSADHEYVAHADVAVFELAAMNANEELKPLEVVEAVRGKTMEEGQKFHGLPMWQQLKDVLYKDKQGKLYLAIIRGDLDVNESKLLHVSGAAFLEPATDEDVIKIGSYPGFIAPMGLEEKVTIIADNSLKTVRNMYGGANKKHVDSLNININRDYTPHVVGDIAKARGGDMALGGHGSLTEKHGIEVGNIFQLGYHYTKLMNDATFTDKDGTRKPYYMGCYGIGLGRTMAAVVEQYHDETGITWPETIAPFTVQMVSVIGAEEYAQRAYQELSQAGIEVLWDDREVGPGQKFADADLIGCPVRLVVSPRNGEKIEWKRRIEGESELLSLIDVINRLQQRR